MILPFKALVRRFTSSSFVIIVFITLTTICSFEFNVEQSKISKHIYNPLNHKTRLFSTPTTTTKGVGNKKGQRKMSPELEKVFNTYEPVIGIEGLLILSN